MCQDYCSLNFVAIISSQRYCGQCSSHSILSFEQYAEGDQVMLWVNKVGPYNNPQETYNYYSLPFCKPGKDNNPNHKWGGLGEVLEGNELINSEIDIKFKRKNLFS